MARREVNGGQRDVAPYVLHRAWCPALGEWYQDDWGHWRQNECQCDGPKKFEALLTAARDEVATGNARGALQQAVEAIDDAKA